MTLTQEQLHQTLHYDPNTGRFHRRTEKDGVMRLAAVSGSADSYGYKQYRVGGLKFLGHRLAWLYTYGEWPAAIDHINGVRDDNRISNLRLASQAENLQNQRAAHKGSKSGVLGVSWHGKARKWVAKITVKGKQTIIGYFADPNEAGDAYLSAKRRLHSFSTI